MAPPRKDIASIRAELEREFGESPEATASVALLGAANGWLEWFVLQRGAHGDDGGKVGERFIVDEDMPPPCLTELYYLYFHERAPLPEILSKLLPRFSDGTLEGFLHWKNVRGLEWVHSIGATQAFKEVARQLTRKDISACLVRGVSEEEALAARLALRARGKGRARTLFWFWWFLRFDFVMCQDRKEPSASTVARLAAAVGLEALAPSLDSNRRRWESNIRKWRRELAVTAG